MTRVELASEKVYCELVKHILSEKILDDFENAANQYFCLYYRIRTKRLSYLSKNIHDVKAKINAKFEK